jgi:hypothetical protein
MGPTLRAFTASMLLTTSLQLLAATPFEDERSATPIAARFMALAGGPENALALVHSLHNGERVTLVQDDGGSRVPMTTVFDLPTRAMQWDEVGICLALVEDSLAREGVRRPSAEQLEDTLLHVLQSLADGLEWKDISRVHARGKGR